MRTVELVYLSAAATWRACSAFSSTWLVAPASTRAWLARPLAAASAEASLADRYEVTLQRPLGVTIEEFQGKVGVASVRGNALAAGVSAGDELVGLGSFFGDEIWALERFAKKGANDGVIETIEEHIFQCGDHVTLLFARGEATEVVAGSSAQTTVAAEAKAVEDRLAGLETPEGLQEMWECVFTPEYYSDCEEPDGGAVEGQIDEASGSEDRLDLIDRMAA
eukprot:CAMPEP_0172582616 /NCGR_PEP_ID=MMETSP1068-20121228/2112_1 /TAXON_ID=35684 /ORGANISM="Pseudopedinella elastica, Strain CCMP716" /LENGTH=221 /DNA_ID=CAMNT_0013376073 /DNA_START=64 /DNA_END=729 /DNA_ORIENTATION=+